MTTQEINRINHESLLAIAAGDAATGLRLIAELMPNAAATPSLWTNQGLAQQMLGEFDEARISFERAIALSDKEWLAHYNLGRLLFVTGNMEAAQKQFIASLEINSKYAHAWNNLGLTLEQQYHFDAALRAFDQAILLEPDYQDTLINKAILMYHTHHLDDAELRLRAVIDKEPDNEKAHYNLAMVLLSKGSLTEGFREYEWRLKTEGSRAESRGFLQSTWDGSNFLGKTLLLHAEQGLGDTIQSLRYLPLVLSMGGEVVLEVQKEVWTLALDNFAADKLSIITRGDELPEFDIQLPLLSLPNVLGLPVGIFGDVIPYLHADSKKSEAWHSRFEASAQGKLKVGIAWQGSRANPNDNNRSMEWSDFEPIVNALHDRIQFYSLQKGEICPSDHVLDHTREFLDLSDTAAYIANLDLVLSVDTSVIHVAGAMGKLCWTMVSYISDWRWTMCESRTGWYPTMELFWQRRPADWLPVVSEVIHELTALHP